uniref:Uncharacterized protein n=1 Tax=Panagrolaimus sp. PS1159 TaxID=55785 RepID=A0AC35F0M4_9BILA
MKLRRLNSLIIVLLSLIATESAQSEDDPFVSSLAPKPDLQSLCINFLECESEMMNIHQKCTEKSRKATGEACGLMDDFKQLNTLMEARVNEFGECTGNETEKIENDPEQLQFLELPYEKCEKVVIEEMEKIMIDDGCWKAVAVVKQRCQQLQKCCPAAKICMKSGRNSDATKEVRQKHIEINRKTLECRNNMKKILDEQKKAGKAFNEELKAKAHAVLTAEGDTLMDAIQKKYVFNKKERHEMRIMRNRIKSSDIVIPLSPHPSTIIPQNPIRNLSNQNIQKIMEKNNNRKPKVNKKFGQQSQNNNPLILFNAPSMPNVKHVGRPISQNLNTVKPKLKQTILPRMNENRLQQFEEFENMLHSLEAKTVVTKKLKIKNVTPKKIFLQRINTKNASSEMNENNLFPIESKVRDGFIPRFKSINQPLSFALPPTVNLTKMNMFEARPALKIQMKKSFKNFNILGKADHGRTNRPRIQSIQTQTDFDKPIMKSFKIDQDLVPFNNNENLSPEAFVSNDGTWTLEPGAAETTTQTSTADKSNNNKHAKLSTNKNTLNQHSFSENGKKIFGEKQASLNERQPNEMPSDIVVFNKKQENVALNLSEISTETSMLRTTMKAPIQDFPKMLKSVSPPKIRKMSKAEETEMLVVKEDLIKNLEQFVKSKQMSVELKQKFSAEPSRIEMLRTTKKEFETEQISMDYCKLYAICSQEQKFVTKSCDTGIGKLIPGLPRRRFGKCNKRLVTEYKRMNSMKQKVERLFEKCLSEKIAFNMPTTETCSKDWPILPEFEREATCIHRVRLVQNHCAKLSRCCTASQDCRIIVDEMPISTKLIQKEEAVAQASAKCQIKAYSDYLKYKTKRFGDVKADKRNGGNKNDIRFESNGYHISTSKTPQTTVTPTPTTTPKPLQLFTTRKISLPNRVYPELLHIGNFQPQSQSIQIDDKKLSNLRRIDTSHVKLLWE